LTRLVYVAVTRITSSLTQAHLRQPPWRGEANKILL
jgi:hypothetical protein